MNERDMNQLEFLQIELSKTQAMIGTYHQLSERKQNKRRYFEDYCRLVRRELWLKAEIQKINWEALLKEKEATT